MKVKHYTKNLRGKDYCVGDIHGMYTLLEEELNKINFDFNEDRLFAVGDLADRGAESERCLDFLAQSWFHSVRGNHEVLAIDYLIYGETGYCRQNGMGWFLDLPRAHQELFAEAFEKLPIAIDVIGADDRLYGLVHAECNLNSWQDFEAALSGPNSDGYENVALWSRDRINYKDTRVVEGVAKIFVGHTPLKAQLTLGNHYYIDTGACFEGGKLTVVEIK